MTMSRDERIARAFEIFDMVYGDAPEREAYNVLDDCISDIYGWAEEVQADPGPYRLSNEKIAEELRKIGERLSNLDLEGER